MRWGKQQAMSEGNVYDNVDLIVRDISNFLLIVDYNILTCRIDKPSICFGNN